MFYLRFFFPKLWARERKIHKRSPPPKKHILCIFLWCVFFPDFWQSVRASWGKTYNLCWPALGHIQLIPCMMSDWCVLKRSDQKKIRKLVFFFPPTLTCNHILFIFIFFFPTSQRSPCRDLSTEEYSKCALSSQLVMTPTGPTSTATSVSEGNRCL